MFVWLVFNVWYEGGFLLFVIDVCGCDLVLFNFGFSLLGQGV